MNIFKRQKHRFNSTTNFSSIVDVRMAVFSFNLNLLLFCLKLFPQLFFRENKIRISNYIQKKQNSLVVLKHSRKTHKISSKLCCATEKKLIREANEKENNTKCLSFPSGDDFSLTCKSEGERNESKTKGITR